MSPVQSSTFLLVMPLNFATNTGSFFSLVVCSSDPTMRYYSPQTLAILNILYRYIFQRVIMRTYFLLVAVWRHA